jgi:hypothetical protein
MGIRTFLASAAAILVGAAAIAPGMAQTDDIFAFIPLGGRSLLANVFAAGAPADQVNAIVAGADRSREEWLSDLKARGSALPGLEKLDDKELLTLADYLALNMPLPVEKRPADPSGAKWEQLLPRDGRDLALEYCQSCHIITVVVTQDRTREAWLGTMNKPSHIEIATTPAEREALASYLVINAGIPIDLVPEDLRAGGATY